MTTPDHTPGLDDLIEALESAEAALNDFPGDDAGVTFAAVWKWLTQRQEATETIRAALTKTKAGQP